MGPLVLLVIVILAIGFFLLGLLQLVIRFVMKRPSFSSISHSSRLPDAAPHTFQRQLQHLFRLHDSGLDQSLIDALPIFYYKDIIGLKEPFDCAVCLSELSFLDKLKVLPNCSHAFHVHCIETWLLSNSTCPLCRSLIGFGNYTENPLFTTCDLDHQWSSLSFPSGASPAHNGPEMSNAGTGRTLSIRLGKFRSTNEGVESEMKMQKAVTSSSIDARRCYSMGAFQYVVGDANLQVALPHGSGVATRAKARLGSDNVEADGKKIGVRSRGDSFSVSKIWLWSKKGKLTTSSQGNESIVILQVVGCVEWNLKIGISFRKKVIK
ncbi:RING-H2 finger protein ATL47-like [Salvia splendens]|uniref:RING-H2 finger protein ATL47-like n=1 Tax=Salvia splendens TaxID=180675 RepID=UPI001C279953|nr:RING-H2 finger protein ATL47-like [Salvia splendens]XP_042015719.1 RING-H2 finger protein ATL47-like [Salvia splendens]XP_042015720.1 RING-H2 finger protein ATL47-like [Salvia splendens]